MINLVRDSHGRDIMPWLDAMGTSVCLRVILVIQVEKIGIFFVSISSRSAEVGNLLLEVFEQRRHQQFIVSSVSQQAT